MNAHVAHTLPVPDRYGWRVRKETAAASANAGGDWVSGARVRGASAARDASAGRIFVVAGPRYSP